MAWTVLVVLLGAAGDQHLYPADPLVPPRATEPGHAVHHFEHHSGRHVAGAFRDRRHQPAPRFPFILVGFLQADIDRLGHLRWDFGIILHADVLVPALGTGDLDV